MNKINLTRFWFDYKSGSWSLPRGYKKGVTLHINLNYFLKKVNKHSIIDLRKWKNSIDKMNFLYGIQARSSWSWITIISTLISCVKIAWPIDNAINVNDNLIR